MSGATTGQIVGGAIGAVVGFFSSGPIGAVQGFAVGWSLGGVVDPPAGPNVIGPRLNDKKVITSTYGEQIPLVYGPENRLSGNVIWSTGLLETENEEESGGKGGGGSTTTTYSYRISFAINLAVFGTAISRIWANNKLIYDVANAVITLPIVDDVNGQTVTKAYGTHAIFEELHFYNGSAIQIADSVIESYKGVGNTPAYRHNCYAVIKDMQLADFGNRLPNIEVELSGHTTITVGEIIHDICGRVNVPNTSVIGLTQEVHGYVVGRASNASGAITPLAMAYHFDIAEQRGQVRFVKRAQAMKAVIPIEDMGCRGGSDNPINPIRHRIGSTLDMPKEISVSFADLDLDYQTNSQRALRDQGSAENIRAVEFPLTLTADEGRQIADRLLWSPWAARKSAQFRVSDKWVRRDPGDILGISVSDQIVPYKMIREIRGDNGILDIEMQRDDPELYNSAATGSSGTLPENTVRYPGETRLIIMDMPIVRDLDDNNGFYWAVTAESSGWRGSRVLRSSDGGTTFSTMSDTFKRTIIGDVAVALADGQSDTWDRGNSLTVVLTYANHQLESKDELLVLNGQNSFWLGSVDGQNGEIVQFATATLTAPNTYMLTDLLRGRLGTEANTGLHGVNEVFVLLNTSSMGRSDFGPADWGIERDYKGVSILNNEADVTAQQFTNDGVGKTPYSPVHVLGVRDGSNNLTITWVRRSRLRTPGLGHGPVPLGEETEAYEIDIYSGVTIVNTLTTALPTLSYSAAEQTADGLTPGNPVNMRIYQISAIRGRGFPAISMV